MDRRPREAPARIRSGIGHDARFLGRGPVPGPRRRAASCSRRRTNPRGPEVARFGVARKP
ncbi:hypothetical protein CIB93_10610 [Streptomyces sp. WZ.A104]|nr:hypothetical protein CIB93_10610 [Streptomyces sp. WZ.A104]